MTTIAWRPPTLAADSQITAGDTRTSKATKLSRLPNGALVGWSGSLVNGSKFLKLLEKNGGKLTSNAIEKCPNIEAIYISPEGKVFHVEGGDAGGCAELEGEFFAEGSGHVAALAAMKAGADAVRAVEIAAELDVLTALPVVSLTLGEDAPVKKRRRK